MVLSSQYPSPRKGSFKELHEADIDQDQDYISYDQYLSYHLYLQYRWRTKGSSWLKILFWEYIVQAQVMILIMHSEVFLEPLFALDHPILLLIYADKLQAQGLEF